MKKKSVRCPNCEKRHMVTPENLKLKFGDWCDDCVESFKEWAKNLVKES